MKRLLSVMVFIVLLFGCGDNSVDEQSFNSANIKYTCPVCNEKLAMFCLDCESPNMIWCADNSYVNSIFCKDCNAYVYPTNVLCSSCEKVMRGEKTHWSNKSGENHPDCSGFINY